MPTPASPPHVRSGATGSCSGRSGSTRAPFATPTSRPCGQQWPTSSPASTASPPGRDEGRTVHSCVRQKALWPKPHNVLFDFDATADGAEWIDDIARAARDVPDAGREVVGHADWSAKHLRFDDDLTATAIYDWDSVTTDPEPSLVGTAAASFTYTEELAEPIFLWPSADESLAFIAEYEAGRGEAFTTPERRSALAACVYLRAYAARCQHAIGDDARSAGLVDFAGELLG